MEIKKFWIVTKPTKSSEFGDICFEANVRQLNMMFLGGLWHEEIAGVFTDEVGASQLAVSLLYERDCDLENEEDEQD